jgi:hypothetical protein
LRLLSAELLIALAEITSLQHEPDGTPNAMFVFYFARSVYFSEFPDWVA